MVNDAAETRSESAKHLPVIYMLFALMIFVCISLYLMLNPNLNTNISKSIRILWSTNEKTCKVVFLFIQV